MEMNGVQLCARFSLATNRLRYCGPEDADSILYQTVVKATDTGAARTALEKFEALLPYLEAIARKHGLDPFDRDVVEAYWVGNELLEGFTKDEFRAILGQFTDRGLPRSVAERLGGSLPPRPIPHHAFHVTFVGVGAVSGKVSTTIDNMERCRPSCGRVVEVSGTDVTLEKPSLALADGRLVIGPPQLHRTTIDPNVIPEVCAGDTLALHWGWPALLLDSTQRSNLEKYTYRALEAANSTFRMLRLL
ncbi:MAG TPA: DUF6390 family protein [Thermoplasmata archaeon]|nr:DUF6390 family protein [Thermoplasmata archaeon]HLA46375.1 DUF6390 family protein [Thermoplasmata archaeon]